MSGDTINSDLIRGNIDTIILRALYEGDRYGYDILKEIEQRSKGQYQLKQPTLYSCLKRLETQGFIKSYWGAKSIGGRRKYFTLTDMGKEIFVRNKADWEYSRTLIDALIAMGDENASSLSSGNIYSGQAASGLESELNDNESFNEEDLEIPEETNSEEVSDSVETNETLNNETVEEPAPYCDAVVYIDEEPFSDSELQENLEEKQKIDSNKEIDLKYSSDYSEKQSYIGTMRDKTYTPEKADLRFEDYELSENMNSDEKDEFFSDAEETYHEHGEIVNPIDFSHTKTYESNSEPKPEPEPEPKQKSKPEFYNYHSDVGTIENVVLPETDGTALLNKINEKAKYKPEAPSAPSQEPQPVNSRPPQTETPLPEFANNLDDDLGRKIQIRKFAAISQTVSDYGDELKVRQHDENTAREFNNKFYYYSNRLALYKYGILFGMMLIEILISFCIIQYALKPEFSVSRTDLTVYILSVIFAAAFPLIAAINCSIDYNKRKRANFKIWTSLAYKLIFMVQAILIVYALNIYLGMPLSTSAEYYVSLIIPSVLSLNLPLSDLIFNKLLKTGKFNVGA